MNTDQLAYFSGNWSNTDNAGVFQLNVNHSASNSNANYSRRLMFFKILLIVSCSPQPYLLVKDCGIHQGGEKFPYSVSRIAV